MLKFSRAVKLANDSDSRTARRNFVCQFIHSFQDRGTVMTEIKIEKKPVWPWALVTLIAIGLLVYVLAARKAPVTQPEKGAAASLIDVRENNPTVEAYVRFVDESKNMGLDHVYTSTALSKLTEATNAMAGEAGVEVKAELDKAKQHADAITVDKFSTSHADSIRNAADIQSDALQTIQQAKYPELANDASELKNAAAAIKPGVLTLDQKEPIKGFFGKAADLLKKMN
jgi:hypothetical protein